MTLPDASPQWLVVLDGEGPAPRLPAGGGAATVVVADGGLALAQELGLRVDHVVGDLDSVDPTDLAHVVEAGAQVHRHEADKDATDGELAIELVLRLAAGAGPGRLTVLGPAGGRLDHLLADLLVLGRPDLARFEVTGRLGPAVVTVVTAARPRRLTGRAGEHVSLIPILGRTRGVVTDGLRWPLVDADLTAASTRGLSNELVGTYAEVGVTEGTVLVIQPGTASTVTRPRTTPYDPSPVDPG